MHTRRTCCRLAYIVAIRAVLRAFNTPGIHLRGLDRNAVIVDGTNPGRGTCSSDTAAQNLGPGGSGRNDTVQFNVIEHNGSRGVVLNDYPWTPDTAQEVTLTEQLGCASLGLCAGLPPPLYPVQTQVTLLPIPREVTMANPCAGVPADTWCPGSH